MAEEREEEREQLQEKLRQLEEDFDGCTTAGKLYIYYIAGKQIIIWPLCLLLLA